jgi:hypothetical protein
MKYWRKRYRGDGAMPDERAEVVGPVPPWFRAAYPLTCQATPNRDEWQ